MPDLNDFVAPIHVRELHLLQRVLFFVGMVSLVGAFVVKSAPIGLAGIGVMLGAVALNHTVNLVLGLHSGGPWTGRIVLVSQLLIAAALSLLALSSAWGLFAHGSVAYFLKHGTTTSGSL
jgi:hypothetical protein